MVKLLVLLGVAAMASVSLPVFGQPLMPGAGRNEPRGEANLDGSRTVKITGIRRRRDGIPLRGSMLSVMLAQGGANNGLQLYLFKENDDRLEDLRRLTYSPSEYCLFTVIPNSWGRFRVAFQTASEPKPRVLDPKVYAAGPESPKTVEEVFYAGGDPIDFSYEFLRAVAQSSIDVLPRQGSRDEPQAYALETLRLVQVALKVEISDLAPMLTTGQTDVDAKLKQVLDVHAKASEGAELNDKLEALQAAKDRQTARQKLDRQLADLSGRVSAALARANPNGAATDTEAIATQLRESADKIQGLVADNPQSR